MSSKREPRPTKQQSRLDGANASTDQAPGLLKLFLYRPPWVALGLAFLALLLSRASDPTNPEATGVSPRVFALPILAVALATALPTLLRSLSQKRALAQAKWISARVTAVEILRSEAVLPRHRIMWADPVGRAGRSLIIRKRWVPPKDSKVRVFEDPANGKQWWEGDIPGAIPIAPLKIADEDQISAEGAPFSAAISQIGTWVAIFAGMIWLLLAFSGAPLLLALLPAVALVFGLRSTMLHLRALDRALRNGKRLEAKVTAHRATPMSIGLGLGKPKGAAMLWETRQGHFGETNFVAADQVVPVGQKLSVCVDPVTGVAFWENA